MNNDPAHDSRTTGWFPGHMLKAEKAMQKLLPLVDIVAEIVDARAPLSSRNPKLAQILSSKPHIVIANKADLASPAINRQWTEWFHRDADEVDFINAAHLRNPAVLAEKWKALVARTRQERGATRPLLRPVRLMIVGIPNIGKSTLINRMRMKNVAIMGPKPGVTRSNQWVPLAGGIELLDTPGVLWPQLRDKQQELLLTALGNISDDATDPVETCDFLISRLCAISPGASPFAVLGLDCLPDTPLELLEKLALRRGMLLPGGRPAVLNAAHALLKDYRNGRLGRFSLEVPPA